MNVLAYLRRVLASRRSMKPAISVPAVIHAEGGAPGSEQGMACELYRKAVHFLAQGNAAIAESLLQQALAMRNDLAEAHLELGRIYHVRGELDDASDCYVLAAHFSDQHLGLLQQGLLALDRGRFQEARSYLERALALDPGSAIGHNALGAALLKLGQTDAAATEFERALALCEDLAPAHSNLGYLLVRAREQFEAGTRHIERALALAPGDPGIMCNWTMVLQHQGRFDEVLALSERLLTQDPSLHEVRLNRALVLLTRGDFHSGWREYEARRHLAPYVDRPARWPEWDGTLLEGKSLFIRSEQGIGDEIMFASCLPDVVRTGCSAVIECSARLGPLFQRSFPATRVVAPESYPTLSNEEIDREILAGSLPRYFRRAVADFPAHEGYLVADAVRVAFWKTRLAEMGDGLKIGISWRGGVQTTRRSLRSVPLAQWLPILRCHGAHFVSLQYGDAAGELGELQERHGIEIEHWQDAIDDLDETAALIGALDLVITVQTAVAHLSGALGKTAWVMIPAVPEWRYMERGHAMPWYPALRLFRRPGTGRGWQELVLAIATNLEKRVAGQGTVSDPAEPT